MAADAHLHQPSPRWGHYSCCIGDKVYVCSGKHEGGDVDGDILLEIFDGHSKTWCPRLTTGEPPPGLINGACASINSKFFTYGGGGGSVQFSGALSQLDISTMKWELLAQSSDHSHDGPMRKKTAGMVALPKQNKLALFGGYGIRSSPNQPLQGASFVMDTQYLDDERGWTNEFHIFNISDGKWSCPSMTGSRPPPCSGFSFSTVDENRAAIFGGVQRDHEQHVVVNDLYIIDFSNMYWSKIEPDPVNWPGRRQYHAACCLDYGGKYPQLLISGGMWNYETVWKDCWLLDLTSMKWQLIIFLRESAILQRSFHSINATTVGPRLVEVIMFGGFNNWTKKTKLSETTILRFKFTQNWDPVGVLTNQQREIEAEFRPVTACNSAVISTNDEVVQIEKNLRQAKDELHATKMSLQNKSRLLEDAEKRAQLVLDQARNKEGKEHWIVNEKEIEFTGQELGGGGWAIVKEAKFRGLKIAAKCFHEKLVSEYTKLVFTREMNMAACIRHPNLVQFIGATLVDDKPIILTELMSTNLRAELNSKQGPITHAQIVSISLDVARALNYLHLMQPDPIIHRDIRSANVLLNPLPNDQWKAKICDYGTVNFCGQLFTPAPGHSAYTAPEAGDPAEQSPKMDIFSFGVLLIEMLTGKIPDTASERMTLGTSIQHHSFFELLVDCISEEKDDRPTADYIIAQLTSF